jgi:two-component system LytT family response regulator
MSSVPISPITPTDNLSRSESLDPNLLGVPVAVPPALFDGCTVPDIRVVVAGPNDSVRKELCLLLTSEPGVRVTAECDEGDTPFAIKKHNPDVLAFNCGTRDPKSFRFLIRFPDEARPLTILLAADEKYASRAFAVNAVGFLTEPLCKADVHEAITRARGELRKSQYVHLAQQMLGSLQQPVGLSRAELFVFKSSGSLIFLDPDEIDWIVAAANYVLVNANGQSYPMRESIGRLSGRLDRRRFIRIHRSMIVNVHRIKELQPCNSGEYIAILKNGKKLACSRGFRGEIDRLVAECK